MKRRRGFALLTVLWVMVAAALLMVQVSHTARESMGTARNRIGGMRAGWGAAGCLARLRAALGTRLASAADVEDAWARLDAGDGLAEAGAGCDMQLVPTGIALDVNVASPAQLRTVLTAAGTPAADADSLADAIVDWRDAGDESLPHGAETAWYRARHRAPPRDSLFAAREELRLVRGWTPRLDSLHLLDVEPGAVLLTRAPAEVLAALPGWTVEMVARVVAVRGQTSRIAEVAAMARPGMTTAPGTTVSVVPEAWVATVTMADPLSGVRAGVEVRLVRSGRRIAILRHRTIAW